MDQEDLCHNRGMYLMTDYMQDVGATERDGREVRALYLSARYGDCKMADLRLVCDERTY